MVYPSKRQKLGGDPPEMGRIHKRDVRQVLPRQIAPVVDITVDVSATLIISVDVDANGVPTATVTLTSDPAASTSSTPALTPAPAIYTTGPSSAAAATPAPASSINSTGSISGTSPTPTGFSSLSPAANSTSSISASNSGPLPAIISAITGNNSTLSSAGALSRSSRLPSSSSDPSSSSSLATSSLSFSSSSYPSSTAVSSSSSGSSASTGVIVGGVPGVVSGSAATGISNVPARNGTTKPNNDNSTSPPVVAGAVVGSVGGMAVILLVLVLVARWWKHHSRHSRYEDNADSTLHLNGTDPNVPTSRRSFLAAAGWLNRLSGTHHNRSSSPTLPQITENERGFQKIAGRKLPSQFPTGTEEGPMARDFGNVPPMPAPRAAHMSDTSSYYRDSRDTTHFFGSAPQTAPLFAGATSDSPPLHDRRRAGPSHLAPESSPFDDPHSETLMPSPARTPHIHQHPSDQYFDHNQPPHSSWPSADDAIRPAPRR